MVGRSIEHMQNESIPAHWNAYLLLATKFCCQNRMHVYILTPGDVEWLFNKSSLGSLKRFYHFTRASNHNNALVATFEHLTWFGNDRATLVVGHL